MKQLIILGVMSFMALMTNAQSETKKEKEISSHNLIKQEKMEAKEKDIQSFNDYQEVVKALQPYIESARSGDGDLSRTAFYDHAHVVGSVDGEFSIVDADEFGAIVTSSGPSENVKHQIAWIDISGPAAAAKVEFVDWLGIRFTDFFVLYKKDGQWKISGKVYDSHSMN